MTNNERFPGNNIHESAVIYNGVRIGIGNVIGPFCMIGGPAEWKGEDTKSGHVVIGDRNHITGLVTIDSGVACPTIISDDCYIMKHAHIGHDAALGDKVTISCGAKIGGHTHIYKGVNIGLNAVIHQQQKIAAGVMIGMGSVVTKKLITLPYETYAGNPAKFISKNIKHPDYPEYIINMKDSL